MIDYTYDNMYNRISKTEDGTVTVYEYDANNRLIRYIFSEEYEYDCDGSRISKTTNEVDVTKYIVDSNTAYADVLAELDAIISDYYRKPPDNYLYNNCQVVIFMDKILIHYKKTPIHYTRRFLSIFCDIIYARLNLRKFCCVDASYSGFPFDLPRKNRTVFFCKVYVAFFK